MPTRIGKSQIRGMGISPIDKGAVGDGIADDTTACLDAWIDALSTGRAFDCSGGYRFRLASAPAGLTANNLPCFFTTNEIDNVELIMGESEFFVDPPASQGASVLFESKGTYGFTFDNINLEVPAAKADGGDVCTALYITYGAVGSSNTTGGHIRGKNCSGVTLRTDLVDYIANGRDSIYRPKNTFIDSIVLDNSAMVYTSTNEYGGYGLACVCSGDNTIVNHVNFDRIHRGLFLYGVKGVNVLSGLIKESDASTINLGSYGSIEDINIKCTLEQTNNLATALTRIYVHEVGNSGGQSLDIQAARTHVVRDIDLDLNIVGATSTTLETGFLLGKSTESGAPDSPINIDGVRVHIQQDMPSASRGFLVLTEATAQSVDNMTVSGVVISGECNTNSAVNLTTESDDIVVRDYKGQTLYCTYGDTSLTSPPSNANIILDRVTLFGTTDATLQKDCPVIVNDSHLNTAVNNLFAVSPYNKVIRNTYLGNAFIESKPRYGVYTFANDSSAEYDPDFPVSGLIGGAFSPNETADLYAPTNYTLDVGREIYHDNFIGGTFYNAGDSYRVMITATASGSNYAIATGTLVGFGVSGNDFTTGTFSLQVDNVHNTGTAAFAPGDFSLTVVDAVTLRFTATGAIGGMVVRIKE